MSHTQGPWEWDSELRSLSSPTDEVISWAPYENSWLSHLKTPGMREANARLIAAAPDLLEALIDLFPYAQACIGRHESTWPHDSVLFKARDAIEKATKP